MSSREYRTSAPCIRCDSEIADPAQPASFGTLLGAVLRAFRKKHRHRLAAAHLASLSDHHLRDIGIDRSAISDVVNDHRQLRQRLVP